ncbi:type II secretion system protein [Aeoliella mucimassa]|uniref:Uncharacterized protein n=1 Tax=Aeoliella mucimassa TaxID=2527972 RepID=A0A518AH95_9BACT|nr:hypothetical protein [Aeoliella mucimassa]QDU54064.1 hypothetical protein Pan181_02440 [Aeoliella mucimassa]
MIFSQQQPATRRRPTAARRGVTLLVVIVIISVSMLILAGAVRSLVDEHRQTRLRHTHRQCRIIAHAALERARAKHLANNSYTGETWTIDADEVEFAKPFQVTIEVEPSDGEIQWKATARYPAEGTPEASESAAAALNRE